MSEPSKKRRHAATEGGEQARPQAPAPIASARTKAAGWTLPPARSKRGHERREAILDAATEEFLSKGFQGASLRSIVATAGGSSRTLYQQFGDKAGLFRAIIARLEGRVSGLTVPDVTNVRPIEQELYEVGLAYLTSFLQPEPLAFFRMMIAESASKPEIPVMVWGVTHKPFATRLATYLAGKCALEGCPLDNPELAALQFIEATKGAIHLDMLFTGLQPTPEDLSDRVLQAVDLFLNGARHAGSARAAVFGTPSTAQR